MGVNAMTFRGLFRIKSLDSILEDAEKPEHQARAARGIEGQSARSMISIVLALALVLLITIYLTLVYMQHR